MTDATTSYAGSCHCGAVKFEVRGPITRAMTCTCSICERLGAVWHATDEAGLRILCPEQALSVYRFGTLTARHYFCPGCGIHPFSRPRLNPAIWVVNLRCVPAIELGALPTSVFDGANWEAAVQALSNRPGSTRAP